MAYMVMAYIVMAYVVIAYVVMAYVVMAYIVMVAGWLPSTTATIVLVGVSSCAYTCVWTRAQMRVHTGIQKCGEQHLPVSLWPIFLWSM